MTERSTLTGGFDGYSCEIVKRLLSSLDQPSCLSFSLPCLFGQCSVQLMRRTAAEAALQVDYATLRRRRSIKSMLATPGGRPARRYAPPSRAAQSSSTMENRLCRYNAS
jgi:hypothetical protein